MAFALKCPSCRKKFPWVPTQGLPDMCPNPECNSRMGHDNDDTVIVMPSIRSARTAATDKVYRDMERGSEVRAQAASDLTGASMAEMSDLKITDLRPTTRHGDIAAPPLPAHLQGVGSFGGGQAVEYGGMVQAGPHPNAGAQARTMLHQHHEQLTRGAATSDQPALETLQPGYRRRG